MQFFPITLLVTQGISTVKKCEGEELFLLLLFGKLLIDHCCFEKQGS